MEVNGEAIHGSRLWAHYEDGDQVRYTQVGDHIFAISLGWPGRQLILHRVEPERGSEIHLLGHDQPLTWSFDEEDGLTITTPEAWQDEAGRAGKYAYSFRIEGRPVGETNP